MYKLDKKERALRDKIRGRYAADSKWYAIMTHFGEEGCVRDHLECDLSDSEFDSAFLPEIKTEGGSSPQPVANSDLLFPCYVFLGCKMTDSIYMAISAYKEVKCIIGRAFRIPSPIEDSELQDLRAILRYYERPELVSLLKSGTDIEVKSGILKGVRGRIINANRQHVRIETTGFSFLGYDTGIAVTVPWRDVRTIQRSNADPLYESEAA